MAIAVTFVGNTPVASGNAAVTGITVPAGSLIFVETEDKSNSASDGTLSDGGVNTYVKIARANLNGAQANGNLIAWYVKNCNALSGATLTFTPAIAGPNYVGLIYATGIDTVAPLDTAVTASATGSSTTPSATSGTPAVSGELFVGSVAGTTGAFTDDGAWASQNGSGTATVGVRCYDAYQVNAGAGTLTYAPTFSLSNNWADIVVGFKLPSAAAVIGRSTPMLFRPDEGGTLRGLTPVRAFPTDPNIPILEVGYTAPNFFRPYQGPTRGLSRPRAFPPLSTGASFNQAITVASTTATSFLKSVGKIVSPSSTTATSFLKAVTHAAAVTSATATSVLKAVTHAIALTSTTATTVIKSSGKTITTTIVGSVTSMLRSVGKIIAPTPTTTTTFARAVTHAVSVTSTTTTTILKAVSKAVSVTATTATTFARQVGKTVSAVTLGTVSTAKAIGKGIIVACSSLVALILSVTGKPAFGGTTTSERADLSTTAPNANNLANTVVRGADLSTGAVSDQSKLSQALTGLAELTTRILRP